jgi:hypothetical protein
VSSEQPIHVEKVERVDVTQGVDGHLPYHKIIAAVTAAILVGFGDMGGAERRSGRRHRRRHERFNHPDLEQPRRGGRDLLGRVEPCGQDDGEKAMTVRRLGEARDKAQPRIQQQGIAAAQVRQQSDTAAVLEATALSAEQIGSINDQLVTINQRIDGLEQNEP